MMKGCESMERLTPIRAIRKKYLDCCAGQTAEVRACTLKTCALHPYRMGRRPKGEEVTAGSGTDEKNRR